MPAPKPDPSRPYSRHRDPRRGMLVLRADGCSLPAPKLPAGSWSPAERRLWRELWASPQAVMWDDSFTSAVAMYVRHVTAVLEGRATAWMATEARFLGDRLGLTPMGLHGLGWRLPELGEQASVVPLRAMS